MPSPWAALFFDATRQNIAKIKTPQTWQGSGQQNEEMKKHDEYILAFSATKAPSSGKIGEFSFVNYQYLANGDRRFDPMLNDSDREFLELVKLQSRTANIPPELDDLPLNVFEFRVLCRIIRWGECSEPVKDMSKAIQVDKKTIYETLQRLTDRGFVEKTVKPGHPTVYRSLINY